VYDELHIKTRWKRREGEKQLWHRGVGGRDDGEERRGVGGKKESILFPKHTAPGRAKNKLLKKRSTISPSKDREAKEGVTRTQIVPKKEIEGGRLSPTIRAPEKKGPSFHTAQTPPKEPPGASRG